MLEIISMLCDATEIMQKIIRKQSELIGMLAQEEPEEILGMETENNRIMHSIEIALRRARTK